MKPVCVSCQRFFRLKTIGFSFIEAMPNGKGDGYPAPGTTESKRWTPYKIWRGDLWKCEGCGAQIVSGVAGSPWSEHYQPDFQKQITETGASQLQVNDC